LLLMQHHMQQIKRKTKNVLSPDGQAFCHGAGAAISYINFKLLAATDNN